MEAKGHDNKLSLLTNVNGVQKELKSFRTQESLSITFGLGTEIINQVGAESPRVTGNNEESVIAISISPSSADFWDLVLAQVQANRPNATRTPLTIDITTSVDLGAEGRVRLAFTGGVARTSKTNVGGRVERMKGDIEIVYGNPPKRI